MIKFWVHKEGWLYTGDETEGSRLATEDEIDDHQRYDSELNSLTANTNAMKNRAQQEM